MSYHHDYEPLDPDDASWSALDQAPWTAHQQAHLAPARTASGRARRAFSRVALVAAALAILLLTIALVPRNPAVGQAVTRQATVQPTATWAAAPTPTATPTLIPPPNPFRGHLLFDDSLKSNRHGWCYGLYSTVVGSFHTGALQINNSDVAGGDIRCLPQGGSFGDFAYQVEMIITKATSGADGGGLIFRVGEQAHYGPRYYYFRVGPDGSYDLNKHTGLGPNLILAQGFSGAIKTGLNQTNLLGVAAKGSTLDLYINGQFVASVEDSAYTHGAIGLFAYDSGVHPAEANPSVETTFRNVKVWAA